MSGLFNELQPSRPASDFTFDGPRRCSRSPSSVLKPSGPADARIRLLDGLQGHVVEVGAGRGFSFMYYPRSVDDVLAIEPVANYREHAAETAKHAHIPIQVVPGDAHALPLPDECKDAAVVSLLLCAVDSPTGALAELHRVVRPGGELRFFEHVRSDRPFIARIQDALTPLWLLCRGCHPNRDAESAIEQAGFEIVAISRFNLGWVRFGPGALRVIGRAVRR